MDPSSSCEKSSDNVTQASQPVNAHTGAGAGAGALSKKHLLQAAGVVGAMTFTSRILGMVRDILSAKKFGTTWQWDAFVYAFMLPNFFRRLVSEGALSSAFIPVYTETAQAKGKREAFDFANRVSSLIGVVLLGLVIALEAGLHLLLKISSLTPTLHLALDLLRTFFPYLYVLTFYAFTMGILNSHRHFFSPALGPVILDLFWIAGILWIVPHAGRIPEKQLHWLAYTLFVSGLVQFSADLPALFKLGFRFKWAGIKPDEGVKKSGRLLVPALLNFGVVQINLLVDSTCAYLIGTGANSALWYGNRIMQFPLGVFSIAAGTALLPEISAHTAKNEPEAAKSTMSFALRATSFVILPCTVGLIVLAGPIVKLLFERGAFDAVSTARTASVMAWYSLGLFAYSGQKMVSTGFYAAHETRIPARTAVFALIANVILNFCLMGWMKESGLALSTSIVSILQFALLIYFYDKKISAFPFREVFSSFARISAAAFAMGGVAFAANRILASAFGSAGLRGLLLQVFGTIFISVTAYSGFCFAFRVREMEDLLHKAKGKR